MANLLCTDTELQTVANAIRSKGNTSAALGFPTGMKNAIDALNVGANLSPAAAAGDIRNGKKAVVNRQTITGSMSEKAAATYNTSSSDQSIAANQYLTGAQTIKAVTTSNISAGNIKSGVVVKVGDANSAGRIKNITGTYKSSLSVSYVERVYNVNVVVDGSYAHVIEFDIPNVPANEPIVKVVLSFDGTTYDFTKCAVLNGQSGRCVAWTTGGQTYYATYTKAKCTHSVPSVVV